MHVYSKVNPTDFNEAAPTPRYGGPGSYLVPALLKRKNERNELHQQRQELVKLGGSLTI